MIGRAVIELLGVDTDAHAVSRRTQPARPGVTWWTIDLAEPGEATRLMREVEPEILIHLAGEVNGARSLDTVRPTLNANLVATVEFLEASTRLSCRRVILSGSLLEEPVGDAQATPPSPYGASRWAASAYGRMFHALFATPVVILRTSFAYGPGQDTNKLVPHVITGLLAGQSPALTSGDRKLDFVFAEDVAGAYLAAAVAPGVEGQTIDIGMGCLTSVREVVSAIAELIGPTSGVPDYGQVPERPLEQLVEVDPAVAARLLGWRAHTELREGLLRTVAWYRERYAAPDGTTR